LPFPVNSLDKAPGLCSIFFQLKQPDRLFLVAGLGFTIVFQLTNLKGK